MLHKNYGSPQQHKGHDADETIGTVRRAKRQRSSDTSILLQLAKAKDALMELATYELLLPLELLATLLSIDDVCVNKVRCTIGIPTFGRTTCPLE